MSDYEPLLRRLIDAVTAVGSLRTDPWKKAAEAVPRHEFLRTGFFRAVPHTSPTAWAPVLQDQDGWLSACYADESLVTQIAGTIRPANIHGEIMREPTSSSTLPSLVLRMLEDLLVEPDMNVLEIGTGTGYSTAVLCARLGDDHVSSIEYDEGVAQQARDALSRLGTFPTLLTGDGLAGHEHGAPYDRIIATCAVHTVPATWLEQTQPGGHILTTIGGWLNASELVRLTVHEDGTASGPVLSGQVSFMLARPHLPPPIGLLPDLSAGNEREALIGADVLTDWTSRFVAQFAAPQAQHMQLRQGEQDEDVLIDAMTGSWAALYEENGRWIVRQGGPQPPWDAIEDHLGRWHAAGTPTVQKAAVRVTAQSQSIHWGHA
ncbi:ATP-grasp peptide maturase system methyltransferase [Streptomyces rishiriensis]|uniref:Protein-L-isoaspartate O-methyltransferase n=1 Tax=Streptomyces rishiriensis TaxID=68264 RepID=A0ABU0NFR1_STRRH|nr:ATP-grasp peptide maturase system methyltransferase [Streptomyces rishiriensis]MDQ0577936.1 methyltransferase of ATP-grasp peptide maturase system [Streptomyces rishiriensis]